MSVSFSDRIQIGVAVATLFLAVATALMALATRTVAKNTEKEAKAVTSEVEIANAALRASVRPWLTAVKRREGRRVSSIGVGSIGESGRAIVKIKLRNIGNGLALLQEGCLRAYDRKGDLDYYPHTAFFTVPALAPGEETDVLFKIDLRPLGIDVAALTGRQRHSGEVFVSVLYTDADGEQPIWIYVHVPRGDDMGWIVRKIEYRRERDGEAFAAAEFPPE